MRLSSKTVTTRENNCIVVVLSGRVDSLSSGELAASLLTLLEQKPHHLVIDMAQIDYLSSAGMRAFLQVILESEKKSGKVVFFGLSTMCIELLQHANLLHYFAYFDTIDRALKSL